MSPEPLRRRVVGRPPARHRCGARRLARPRPRGLRRGRRRSPAARSGATSRSRRSPIGRSSPRRTRRSSGRSASGSRRSTRTTVSSARSTGRRAATAATRWYIDPIDGTHNFIRGVPLFGTLLAVERDGELQAAVLSAPALRERWWAWRGGGAWAPGHGRRDGAAARSASRRSSVARGRAAPLRLRPRDRGTPATRRASGRSSGTSGASAGSATSGAMRCSRRAPRRQWSRSA